MNIRVKQVSSPAMYAKVTPDFIYNRFDLFCDEGQFGAIRIGFGRKAKVVEFRVVEETGELGLWLTPIREKELEAILLLLHKTYPSVKTIVYSNGILPYGQVKVHNHFRIIFPRTKEEMEERISSKSRAKMRKKVRRAEEDFGPLQLLEYDRESLPVEVVEAFFQFKKTIRGRTYNMTPEEYLDRYHVSHCYVAKFGNTIGAIRFSCEQCDVVYGENFTYNPEMSEYSLGRFIFMHHLIRMVEKGHSELYFAGGDYEYKTHYGSVEETLYDCKIDVQEACSRIKGRSLRQWSKDHLPQNIVVAIWKAKNRVKKWL